MGAPKIERLRLTEAEVAFFTGLSIHSLRSARSNKPNLRMPPFVRVGCRVRYDLDALLDYFFAKASRGSIPPPGTSRPG